MKKTGFSLLEVVVIMAVTTLISLGTISLIRAFQKSTKQMKQLGDFEVLTNHLSKQLSQMTDDECLQYLPASLNTNIYVTNRSDPTDPMTQTPMYLMTEASSPNQVRISGDRANPTKIGSAEYQLMLTTTDNICGPGPAMAPTKDFWCSGTLNLVVRRVGSRSDFFGLTELSRGFVADQGHVANIVFKTTPSGRLDKCAYVPNTPGGAIDYGTCAYYADPPGYGPISSMRGAPVACPKAYIGLAACVNGCGAASSILCCRLRNPNHYKKENPHVAGQLSGRWDNECTAGDVVTGVCNGCAQPMQCSFVSANVIESFCRIVPFSSSGLTWCNRWEVITDFCPVGATCTRPGSKPGTMRCCKIKR